MINEGLANPPPAHPPPRYFMITPKPYTYIHAYIHTPIGPFLGHYLRPQHPQIWASKAKWLPKDFHKFWLIFRKFKPPRQALLALQTTKFGRQGLRASHNFRLTLPLNSIPSTLHPIPKAQNPHPLNPWVPRLPAPRHQAIHSSLHGVHIHVPLPSVASGLSVG